MKVNVKDNPDLIRDTETGALLSTDRRALQAYKIQKKKMSAVSSLQEENHAINKRLETLEDKLDKLIEIISSNK